MRKIEAIIREEKMQDVLDALTAAEITGITVYQVMGAGRRKAASVSSEARRSIRRFCLRSSWRLSYPMKLGKRRLWMPL